MNDPIEILVVMLALSILVCVGLAITVQAEESGATPSAGAAADTQPTHATLDQQRKSAERTVRPEVEKQRKEAEQQAEKTLDKEAIAAIEETRQALDAIASSNTAAALAAIERATGKVNILLARNPATPLIPVGAAVEVIDLATSDHAAIMEIAQDASRAVDERAFSAARLLLHSLMSEIRVRTGNLPLATYPTALKEAARLLDQGKNKQASAVLLTALNTLVVIDRVTPLPLVLARDAIATAQAERQKGKDAALKLLESAKAKVQRSRDLGYAGKDAEYVALFSQIDDLEKQIKGAEDTGSLIASLKEKLSTFVRQLSSTASRPSRASATTSKLD